MPCRAVLLCRLFTCNQLADDGATVCIALALPCADSGCAVLFCAALMQVVDLPSALASSGLPAAAASWILTAGLTVEFAVLVAGG